MDTVRAAVDQLGGFSTERGLVRVGARGRDLTDAVRSGEVRRARNGGYSTAEETDPAFQAVRVGGRLTSSSALAAEGAWLSGEDTRPHGSVAPNAARLRLPAYRRRSFAERRVRGRGVFAVPVIHWDGADVRGRGTSTSVHISDALATFLFDSPYEEAVAALDGALHRSRISAEEIREIISLLPIRLRPIWHRVDPACDSYPGSIARTRLRMEGYRVISQVPIGARERTDLVVEGQLALGADGEEHHASRFPKDRRKDLRITFGGRHPLRITFAVLIHERPEVLLGIAAALGARNIRMVRLLTNRSPPAGARTGTTVIGVRGRLPLPVFAEVGADECETYSIGLRSRGH